MLIPRVGPRERLTERGHGADVVLRARFSLSNHQASAPNGRGEFVHMRKGAFADMGKFSWKPCLSTLGSVHRYFFMMWPMSFAKWMNSGVGPALKPRHSGPPPWGTVCDHLEFKTVSSPLTWGHSFCGLYQCLQTQD